MFKKPEAILVDFEGVITRSKPSTEDLNSPVWQRVRETRRLADIYRIQMGFKPLIEFTHKPSDFLLQDHTELTSILNLLLDRPYTLDSTIGLHGKSSIQHLVPVAQEIIQKSVDFYLELVSNKPNLKYETNPRIVEFLYELKKKLGDVPFFGVSGNPREVLYDKFVRTGISDLFLINGKFPDWRIYGEHIMSRYQAVEGIQKEMGTVFTSALYLEDRESDLGTGIEDVFDAIRFLHFNERPLNSLWFSTLGPLDTPGATNYLKKLEAKDRIFYLPKGFEDTLQYNNAMEFAVGYRSHGIETKHAAFIA